MSDMHREAFRSGEYTLKLTLIRPAHMLTAEQKAALVEHACVSLLTLLRQLEMQEVP